MRSILPQLLRNEGCRALGKAQRVSEESFVRCCDGVGGVILSQSHQLLPSPHNPKVGLAFFFVGTMRTGRGLEGPLCGRTQRATLAELVLNVAE